MNVTYRISSSFVKKIAFIAVALLLVSVAWGQQIRLSGSGTEDNPYLIGSASDWNEFTNMINSGTGNTAYYKLTNDITLGRANNPITTVVGLDNSRYRFKGHFDGDWHTITIYQSREENIAGPFGTIENATICNLTVEGTIVTSRKYAGGIAGYSYSNVSNPTTLRNCTSNVTIDCSTIIQNSNGNGNKPYDCTHGGLIGQNNTGPIYFESCLFSGSIVDTKRPKTANRVAGFIGWQNVGPTSYTNCTMAGEISVANTYATFQRGNGGIQSEGYFYYTHNYGGNQGSAAPTTDPGTIYKYINGFYIPAQVTGLETTYYEYSGSPIIITPIVTYYGTKLTWNDGYSITVNDNPNNSSSISLNGPGTYHIGVNGNNPFAGTHSEVILVAATVNSWANLKAVLAFGGTMTITLPDNGNYTADENDGAIEIPTGSRITLNLNNKTLDRHLSRATDNGYAIHIASGATLTLTNGTVKGGNNLGNGGGIVNDGTLIMTDVNVTNNKANKKGSNIYGTGGGIFNATGSSFTMRGGTISNNTAVGGGGGVHGNSASSFSMTNVEVSGNQASSKGGGIRIKGSATISNCTITGNQLPVQYDAAHGGGVFSESNSLTMTNCQISENVAYLFGGGICVFSGNTTLTNCTLQRNQTLSAEGGGVCLYSGTLKVYGSTIIGGSSENKNTSASYGGGIFVRGSSTLRVKDAPVISHNERNNEIQNIYLENTSNKIHVDGRLGNDASIGVIKSGNSDGVITSGLGNSGNTHARNFHSDYSGWEVLFQDNEAVLGTDTSPNTFVERGDWNVASNWSKGRLPNEGEDVTINAQATIPNGYTANVGEITLDPRVEIIIAEGAGLIHSNDNVTAAIHKSIPRYENEQSGWYFIASPIADDLDPNNPHDVEDLITGDAYDLYFFDESQSGEEWRNYKQPSENGGGFPIQNTKGYLYANKEGASLVFGGALRPAGAGDVNVNLAYTSGNPLAGWNLVGNPFPCDAYVDKPYYVTDRDGGRFEAKEASVPIPPCTGLLVHATSTGQSIIFSKNSRGGLKRDLQLSLAEANERDGSTSLMDNAIVNFDEGEALPKFVFNENNAKIYIPQGRKDYAVVGSEKQGEMPVHFKAVEDGTYTLTVNPEGVEMDYLHLIDKSTGADIDLLVEPTYRFSATTADAESRFKLVFRANDDEEEPNHDFAFVSNGQIILFDVEGEGTLQLIDLLGHVLSSGNMESTVYVGGLRSGVYVLRLLQSERTLTQKIVIQN